MKSGEWQVEFYKVWNEKGTGKMNKKKHQEDHSFPNSLKRWGK